MSSGTARVSRAHSLFGRQRSRQLLLAASMVPLLLAAGPCGGPQTRTQRPALAVLDKTDVNAEFQESARGFDGQGDLGPPFVRYRGPTRRVEPTDIDPPEGFARVVDYPVTAVMPLESGAKIVALWRGKEGGYDCKLVLETLLTHEMEIWAACDPS